MSRIGKKPIPITGGVEAVIGQGLIKIKGPKGEESVAFDQRLLSMEIKDGNILVLPKNDRRQKNAIWGTVRALVANAVEGVVNGYQRKLEINGIGYRAAVEGEDLVVNAGFTHPVKVKAVDGVSFSVVKNSVVVSGINKEKVFQAAANIRKIRPPEPYKGKGIRYEGEKVRRKVGKKSIASGGK